MDPATEAIGADQILPTKIDTEPLRTSHLIPIVNYFRHNIFLSNAEVYQKHVSLVCLVFKI